MAKNDLVRVHVKSTDQDVTVSRVHAENAGLTILDEPAVDYRGRPLPATRHGGRRIKPRTSVDEAAASKKTTNGGASSSASKS